MIPLQEQIVGDNRTSLVTPSSTRRGDVVPLVAREGMTPALIGIAAGAVATLAAGRLLEKLVFGVSASDPLTFAAVAGALAAGRAAREPGARVARIPAGPERGPALRVAQDFK